jgi:acyl carrier protein
MPKQRPNDVDPDAISPRRGDEVLSRIVDRVYGTLADMPTGKVATIDAVTQQIIGLVEAEVGAVDLTTDSSLLDQGLDSVKVMSLVFKIEAHYDILLEEEDADDLRTVGALAVLVVHRIEEQS